MPLVHVSAPAKENMRIGDMPDRTFKTRNKACRRARPGAAYTTMKTISKLLLSVFLATFALSAEKPEGKPGRKGPAGMPGRMLEMMDTNKDGKVSKEEWQAHHDQRFTEMDTNKDGAITSAEVKEHHGKMREKNAEMCPECQRGKKGKHKGHHKKPADDDND